MAIKNLLVAFNGSETSKNALRAGLLMQRKYSAHLTGILAHEGKRDRFNDRAWLPDNVRDVLEAAIHNNEAEVEAQFRELTGGEVSDEMLHWITLSGEPDHTVAQYARMYDITLVGQYRDPTTADINLHPERIALKSGRPVVVVPADYDEETITKPVVLAWDGRRAATRAMNEAMLILETKQHVSVVSFGDEIRPPLKGIDVVTSLRRHEISAERVRRPSTSRNPGKDILNYCREVDAGTLVMGAFEHSLVREELLGGPTKYVLENAHLPVLLAH